MGHARRGRRASSSGGGNVAFFSGNAVYWQVRYEDDGRTMVCHKYAARENDPVAGTDRQHLLTSIWSDPLIGRPENLTTGLSFCRGGYARFGRAVPRSTGAYTIYRPEHWAFAGTGLRYGDALGLGSVHRRLRGRRLRLRPARRRARIRPARDGTPSDMAMLATAPAHLISNAPATTRRVVPLSFDPMRHGRPRIHGDAPPRRRFRREHRAPDHGHAVMGVFQPRRNRLQRRHRRLGLRARSRSRVQQVTRNVLTRLG